MANNTDSLEDKAYARHEIWQNMCTISQRINNLKESQKTDPDVQNILEGVLQVHAALREYFPADERLDLQSEPNLKPYMQIALSD